MPIAGYLTANISFPETIKLIHGAGVITESLRVEHVELIQEKLRRVAGWRSREEAYQYIRLWANALGGASVDSPTPTKKLPRDTIKINSHDF